MRIPQVLADMSKARAVISNANTVELHAVHEAIEKLIVERDELRDQLDHAATVAPNATDQTTPRTITPSELCAGQRIAYTDHNHSKRWIVETYNPSNPFDDLYDGAIVLLEDAPTEAPEPVAAEDIRESEPGSTFETDLGEIWEWDGSRLHIHLRSNDSMHASLCDPEDLEAHAVVRSTAPSRGDYSGKVPKVGDTISAAEELERLPEGTILRGRDGDAFERSSDGWWMAGLVHPHPILLALRNAPLTVLYLGGE